MFDGSVLTARNVSLSNRCLFTVGPEQLDQEASVRMRPWLAATLSVVHGPKGNMPLIKG